MSAQARTDALEDQEPLDGPDDGTGVHPTIRAAFDALDRTGAAWALVRGADDLRRPSGDVDVLVDPAALSVLDSGLRAAGLTRLPAAGHGSHRFYHRYDPAEDLWLKLDVVTDVAFGPHQELDTDLAAGALARRRRHGGIQRLAPQDEAWLYLLHLLLDKGTIAPSRAVPAAAAARVARATGPVADLVDHHAGAGAAARLLAAVAEGRTSEAVRLGEELRTGWRQELGVRLPARTLVRRAARRLPGLRPADRLPGSLVAVLGPDGAGKTTLSDALTAQVPLPTRYVYMGMWRETRWDPYVRRVPGGRLGRLLVRVFRSVTRARYHRARGRLVVVDRFVYDALLAGPQSSLGERVANAAMLRLGPTPDVLLLLDAPGELMFRRKGEHSAEVLEQRRQAYLALRDRLPGMVVLDASAPVDDVRRQALAVVWDRVAAVVASRARRTARSGGRRRR
jgi:thymidylate kinase